VIKILQYSCPLTFDELEIAVYSLKTEQMCSSSQSCPYRCLNLTQGFQLVSFAGNVIEQLGNFIRFAVDFSVGSSYLLLRRTADEYFLSNTEICSSKALWPCSKKSTRLRCLRSGRIPHHLSLSNYLVEASTFMVLGLGLLRLDELFF